MNEVSPQDHVALLKEGIAVLSVEIDRRGTHVCVAGRDEAHVRKRVAEVLGDEVDVWVVVTCRASSVPVRARATWSATLACCSCGTSSRARSTWTTS